MGSRPKGVRIGAYSSAEAPPLFAQVSLREPLRCRILHPNMKKGNQSFEVGGVEVVLVRDERGAHWECSECEGECEHILKAVVWMTLQSWSTGERSDLH